MTFIAQFQQKHGLKPDGVIGKKTLTVIQSALSIPSKAATAHFIGNTYHETGGFTRFEENLNYSAAGLIATWPSRFDVYSAAQYARKPEQIANKVYANRMGNGTESSGDGWKYRGRGALQTTGRTNYGLFGKYIGADTINYPELLAEIYQLESAEYYFTSNNLWGLASVVDTSHIRAVRKAVNGGLIGIDDVTEQVTKFYKMLTT